MKSPLKSPWLMSCSAMRSPTLPETSCTPDAPTSTRPGLVSGAPPQDLGCADQGEVNTVSTFHRVHFSLIGGSRERTGAGKGSRRPLRGSEHLVRPGKMSHPRTTVGICSTNPWEV